MKAMGNRHRIPPFTDIITRCEFVTLFLGELLGAFIHGLFRADSIVDMATRLAGILAHCSSSNAFVLHSASV